MKDMADTLTCYIIDDEPLAQQILKEYIGKVSFLELIGLFDSPIEASTKIKDDLPDLIFLDINMPDIDGLSYLKMLDPKPFVILVTAYDEFAIEAFALDVQDYLLKPISFDRFYKGVLRLYQKLPVQTIQTVSKSVDAIEKDAIYVKEGQVIKRIALKDILFIKGMKDYLQIVTLTHKIMTLTNFDKMEQQLNSPNFIRVHRSFLVALDKIDQVETNRIKIGKEMIPISDSYRSSFLKCLGNSFNS